MVSLQLKYLLENILLALVKHCILLILMEDIQPIKQTPLMEKLLLPILMLTFLKTESNQLPLLTILKLLLWVGSLVDKLKQLNQ